MKTLSDLVTIFVIVFLPISAGAEAILSAEPISPSQIEYKGTADTMLFDLIVSKANDRQSHIYGSGGGGLVDVWVNNANPNQTEITGTLQSKIVDVWVNTKNPRQTEIEGISKSQIVDLWITKLNPTQISIDRVVYETTMPALDKMKIALAMSVSQSWFDVDFNSIVGLR